MSKVEIIQGIFPDMSEAVYRASPAVNQTPQKEMIDRSPMHCIYKVEHPKPSTPAMEDGTILDQMILTPDREPCYVVMPADLASMSGNKKEVQNWKKEQRETGKIIIKDHERIRLEECTDAVWRHPVASRYLRGADVQVPAFAKHEASGLWIKALADVVPKQYGDFGHVLIDCKKSVNAEQKAFMKQAYQLHYCLQAAQYMHIWNLCGVEITDWIWIVYEDVPPHGVNVIRCPRLDLSYGHAEMEKALLTWAECDQKGIWPGYPETVKDPEVPKWRVIEGDKLLEEVYA